MLNKLIVALHYIRKASEKLKKAECLSSKSALVTAHIIDECCANDFSSVEERVTIKTYPSKNHKIKSFYLMLNHS